ncbi:MAG: NAD-dependent epimerase/dehydratase family protein [Kofleriaceae bacterium]
MTTSAIIAFAKDWHEDPTSNHHVLRELARSRRVVWLNSIATRTPSLASGRDLGKIARKLREFTRGPVNVENDLWVYTPLALPFPHSSVARALNRQVLRATIRMLRARLGIEHFELWTFLPNVGDYVGTLGEDRSVYYCVDEWSLFGYLDRDQTIAAERTLLAKVDAVFAINAALAAAKRAINPATFEAPHGVDHALFARALAPETVVPAELAAIARPRLGFYGTLRDWVDFELLAHVARARPAWQIVLVGQELCDTSAIRGLPNVHLLGQKPHHELPAYCKGFDVGLIPYRIDERMQYVNPLKLREYLSAGLPVVSTPVPEVRKYPELARIAATPDAFVEAIAQALEEDSPERRVARSAAMIDETWAARVAQVEHTLANLAAERSAGPTEGERAPLAANVPYLVTGASGSLGTAIVDRLLAEGHRVRGFVRRMPELPRPGVEYAVGDLGDARAVDRAVAGAEIVIHAGATMQGSWAEHERGTVTGTANVLQACARHGVKQLVYISSLAIVDWAGSAGHVVDEATGLEPHAAKRGAYTRAKLAAEQLASTAAAGGLPCVILRPGQIFGGGIPLINGAVARRAGGRWLVLGDGTLELPLVFIDDVVDAIGAAIAKHLTGGEVIQIVDPEQLTQQDVLDLAGEATNVLHVPRPLVFALGKLAELPLAVVGKPSPISAYRLRSALARLHYESDRARTLLGWQPRVGVREGIKRVRP